jgi:hypothetical protein
VEAVADAPPSPQSPQGAPPPLPVFSKSADWGEDDEDAMPPLPSSMAEKAVNLS